MAFPDSDGFARGSDSGGFRVAPQGADLAHSAVCMGSLTLSKWIPESDGFGTGSVGFGWIRVDSWTLEMKSTNPAHLCMTLGGGGEAGEVLCHHTCRRSELDVHQRDCEFRPVPCEYCERDVAQR